MILLAVCNLLGNYTFSNLPLLTKRCDTYTIVKTQVTRSTVKLSAADQFQACENGESAFTTTKSQASLDLRQAIPYSSFKLKVRCDVAYLKFHSDCDGDF